MIPLIGTLKQDKII